jgi:hypothetical protein
MFGVHLSYLGTAIGLFWQNTSCIHYVYFFPFSHFSQMRKATHFVVVRTCTQCQGCVWYGRSVQPRSAAQNLVIFVRNDVTGLSEIGDTRVRCVGINVKCYWIISAWISCCIFGRQLSGASNQNQKSKPHSVSLTCKNNCVCRHFTKVRRVV